MKKPQKIILFFFLVCLVFSLCFFVVNPVLATGVNWLSGWIYRKSHVINNSTGSGTNYQIMIIVRNGSNSDSGNIVYENNSAFSDFRDLRFTGSDGSTLLNVWNESMFLGINITCWVQIADSLSSSSVTIYLYYGNSGVDAVWSGVATFPLLYDNFDTLLNTSIWYEYGAGSSGNSNYTLNVGANYYISSINSKGYYGNSGFALRVKTFMLVNSGMVGFCPAVAYNAPLIELQTGYPTANHWNARTYNLSTGGTAKDEGVSDAVGHVWDVEWVNSSLALWCKDNVYLCNITSNVPTDSLYVGFMNGNGGSPISMDWILVRKVVYPEPFQSTWGIEEFQTAVTFYFSNGGLFYKNSSLVANNTVIHVSIGTVFRLLAVPDNGSVLFDFNWSYGNSTVNNYNFSVVNATVIWCIFSLAPPPSDFAFYLTIGLIFGVIIFVFMLALSKKF